jgi:hypothetical protein
MSFRLPRNLQSHTRSATDPSPLEVEIAAEKAASLGRAGRALEKALARIGASSDPAEREGRVQDAADALYAFLVQRELCGLLNHLSVLAEFGIPREVTVRVGARPKAERERQAGEMRDA